MATVVQFTITKDNRKWLFKKTKSGYYCNNNQITEEEYNRNLEGFKANL